MSELYVCKKFGAPYERVCKIITTLEEHDKQIRADEREKIKKKFDEIDKMDIQENALKYSMFKSWIESHN